MAFDGNLHPGAAALLRKLPNIIGRPGQKTEYEVAQGIVAGLLQSPYKYENVTLVALRITGTGTSLRREIKEFVFRKPELYLNDEFLLRCNGLPVIWEHPASPKLNSKEFAKRIVGTILLPYIKGDEVWGIAKIYDDEAAELISTQKLSTSPAVMFRDPTVNETVQLSDGRTLLIEGKPSLLDHIAICELGVWDKGGPPTGISSEIRKDSIAMTEDEKIAAKAAEDKAKKDADDKAAEEAKAKKDAAEGDKLDKILSGIDNLCSRQDKYEARLDAIEKGSKKDDDDKPTEEQQLAMDKAKKDAEEKAAAEEKEKQDAEDRKDRARMDADIKALSAKMPKQVSDSDYMEMADAQGKADSVFSAHGQRAPRPLDGETPGAYRTRLATALKSHSKKWKNVDLTKLEGEVLTLAEEHIYADAMQAAFDPTGLPEGTLRAVHEYDDTGRKITRFVGEPIVWMAQFRSPVRRLARPLFNVAARREG